MPGLLLKIVEQNPLIIALAAVALALLTLKPRRW